VIRFLFLLLVAWLVLRVVRRLSALPLPYPGARSEAPWDPHAVLGVPPGASRDVITRGYHDQLKRYHPDRVADLGAELQELAHRKTIELRRAYDELMR